MKFFKLKGIWKLHNEILIRLIQYLLLFNFLILHINQKSFKTLKWYSTFGGLFKKYPLSTTFIPIFLEISIKSYLLRLSCSYFIENGLECI